MTPAIVDAGRALLEQVGMTETAPPAPTTGQSDEQLAKAEAELWAWYIEWSGFARLAIKDRLLLRRLGFLSHKDGDDATPPAAPAPTAPAPTNATSL